jgi:hypothetical protein
LVHREGELQPVPPRPAPGPLKGGHDRGPLSRAGEGENEQIRQPRSNHDHGLPRWPSGRYRRTLVPTSSATGPGSRRRSGFATAPAIRRTRSGRAITCPLASSCSCWDSAVWRQPSECCGRRGRAGSPGTPSVGAPRAPVTASTQSSVRAKEVKDARLTSHLSIASWHQTTPGSHAHPEAHSHAAECAGSAGCGSGLGLRWHGLTGLRGQARAEPPVRHSAMGSQISSATSRTRSGPA